MDLFARSTRGVFLRQEVRVKVFSCVCFTLLSCVGLAVQAQTWPAKAVRIIVAVPPGGTTDLTARLLAKKFTDGLGQTFIVDNRPGASSMIGTELVIRSPADGYTLFLSSASLSINATLFGAK